MLHKILLTIFALHNRSVNAWENARKTLFSMEQRLFFLLQELQESRICQRICLMGSHKVFPAFLFTSVSNFVTFVLALGKM